MRTVRDLLLLFVLLSVLSCGQKKPSVVPNQEVAERLLKEADSLMRADSAFWYMPVDRENPRVCRYDSLVRHKLDDALLMCPSLKKAYLSKYVYLMRSRKMEEVLVLLRKMETNVPDSIAADMWHLKAILEDRAGYRDTARHDFLKADTLYGLALEKTMKNRTDTVQYAMLRLMKALNLSVFYDDFTLIRNEIRLYNGVHQTPLGNAEIISRMAGKEEYYHYLFGY